MPVRSANGMCATVRPISKPPPLISWNIIGREKKAEKGSVRGVEVKGSPGQWISGCWQARDNSTK